MFRLGILILGLMLAGGTAARAQTDEIQVYDASIVEPGQFGLTVHNNFTPICRTQAELPGGIVPNHSLNGVPEFAYGVTDWFEAGLYLPVYTLTGDGKFLLESAKLRALFVSPHADERSFFYGINFELSYNAKRWEDHRISGEIRPIIGARIGPFDFIFNPILDTGFDGVAKLDFAPAARIAYNMSKTWAVAVEHYADFGAVGNFESSGHQFHTLFAVADYHGKPVDVEFGIGHGLTAVSDALVLKLMLSREF